MNEERFCACGASMSANYVGDECINCERGVRVKKDAGRVNYSGKGIGINPPPAAYAAIVAVIIGPVLGMALVAWLIWQVWP